MKKNVILLLFLLMLGVGAAYGQNAYSVYSVDSNGDTLTIVQLSKEAEQGDAHAQRELGFCYYFGVDVEQDYEKAVEWWTKAAEQGDASAQGCLGRCYYYGDGIEQDYEKAVEWCRKAAEQGHAWAQYYLGYCYDKGNGVEKNGEEAIRWWKKAADQGHEEAIEVLKLLDVIPDVNPEFPGDVYAWLAINIKYPVGCQKRGVQGHVSVQFIINQDGSISDVEILRSPDDELSKEAERVIKAMPKWKPALKDGKPVRMRYVLPIMFKLNSEDVPEESANSIQEKENH